MTAALIPERLERGRLRYERVTPDDAAAYAALLTHPQVIPWLWPFANPPTRGRRRGGVADRPRSGGQGLVLYRLCPEDFVPRAGSGTA
ncbi:MAG TPA: hypothetical protein VFN55_02665 [Solirubrobacteraceae bacterium]|nr:hypothetical protein [Solirubrobacteraceae bacterium]